MDISNSTIQPTTQSPEEAADVRSLLNSLDWIAPPYVVEKAPTKQLTQNELDVPGRISEYEHELYKTYISEKGLVGYQIDTYNHWITCSSHRMIQSFSLRFRDGSTIVFRELQNQNKMVDSLNGVEYKAYPKLVKDRNSSYTAPWYMTAVHLGRDGKTVLQQQKGILVGRIPIMVKSMNCYLAGLTPEQLASVGESSIEHGGYYIMGGESRVVLMQEQLALNKILLSVIKTGFVCRITTNLPSGTKINQLTIRKVKVPPAMEARIIELNLSVTSIRKEYKETKERRQFRRGRRVKEEVVETTPTETAKPKKGYPHYNVLSVFRLYGYTYPDIEELILAFLPPQDYQPCLRELSSTAMLFLSSTKDEDIAEISSALELIEGIDAETIIREAIEQDLFPGLNNLPPMEGELAELPLDATEKDLLKLRTYNDRKRHLKLSSLAMMVAMTLQYMCNRRKLDDRDAWGNKRVENSVREFNRLIRSCWGYHLSEIQSDMDKEALSFERVCQRFVPIADKLTTCFYESFVGKVWGCNGSQKRENLVRLLELEGPGPITGITLINTINVPISNKDRQQKLRMVQSSQFAFVCPVYTPEGKTCGITKNVATTTRLSLERDDTKLIRTLYDKNLMSTDPHNPAYGETYLIVDSKYLGMCRGEHVKSELIRLRRSGKIDEDTSIILDGDYLYLNLSPGRLLRPLLVVENNELVAERYPGYNIDQLFERGAIEYVSAWEQEFLTIAWSRFELEARRRATVDAKRELDELEARYKSIPNPSRRTRERYENTLIPEAERKLQKAMSLTKYTHCEMSVSAYLGAASAMIPFIGHNQAPRNQYQVNMQKSAMGIYHPNHLLRADGKIKLLASPATPLVDTDMYEFTGQRALGSGDNVFVAIMAYPDTEEDAFIFKRQALDRGLFRSVKYIIKKIHVKDQAHIGLPPDWEKKKDRFKHIILEGKDAGLPIEGSLLRADDIVIAAYQATDKGYEDISIPMKIGEEGVVYKVWRRVSDRDGSTTVTVKLYSYRVPIKGDKFAPRMAQKGTIGRIKDEWDMPQLYGYGFAPDIIINPHQIISRMTVSYIVEILSGTYTAITGQKVDASPFRSGEAVDYIGKELQKRGFNRFGYMKMVDGKSGRLIDVEIFAGIVFFQALKHQVLDKIQSRGLGPIKVRDMQPTKGRVRQGGLRSGGMELGAFMSLGVSSLVKDAFCNSSDRVTAILCANCGCMATWKPSRKNYVCNLCGDSKSIGKADIPYAIYYFALILSAATIALTPKLSTMIQYNQKHVMSCQPKEYEEELSGSASEGEGARSAEEEEELSEQEGESDEDDREDEIASNEDAEDQEYDSMGDDEIEEW
jgi:DNA-directed RNA polymerase subunit B